MKNNWLFTLLFFSVFSFAQAQMNKYYAKRKLSGIATEWHRIVLPDALFQHLSDDLSDLRIYGITAAQDTIEAPYILELKEDENSIEQIDFKLINQSKTSDGFYYTFELNNEIEVNEIKLNLNQTNFDWKLNLEGSNDAAKWFSIQEDYRILSIENQQTNYRYTTLTFPRSKYKLYRILIKSKTDPGLVTASVSMNKSFIGNYKDYQLLNTKISDDKKLKQTEINLELKNYVPISQVKIWTNSSSDFYRPIELKYLADSVKTEKGWIYTYQALTHGILSSVENNRYSFQTTSAKKIQLLIDNGDNPPVKIDSVTVGGFVYELTVRFTEDADYYLVYGNASASKPNYDISHFTNQIPTELSELDLANEEIIDKNAAPTTAPLFQNKLWLWLIMGTVILVIGGFSLSMLKKNSGN